MEKLIKTIENLVQDVQDHIRNAADGYDRGYYEGYESALLDVLAELGIEVDDDDDFRQ